jgi:hypothetical protein
MSNLTSDLDNVWRDVCEGFGLNEAWSCNEAKCKNIHQRLLYFNESHLADSDYIDDVVQSLSRGFYLTKSAVQWHEPTIGRNLDGKPNNTQKARGVQWRLVMAYGGFETTTKTLLKMGRGGLSPGALRDFTNKCSLPTYTPLPSPKVARVNLDKWLNKPPATPTGQTALIDFLSLEHGDAQIVEAWMVQAAKVSSWTDAVRLAKALRNATAHGALSATKVKQWGLENAIFTLSDNLGELVVAGLRKLM